MPDLADDGAMAAKRGRPLKGTEPRDKQLVVRVSEPERLEITTAAERAGLPVADFLLTLVRKS
jgi:uncharacterized protein (DUF1778 family)